MYLPRVFEGSNDVARDLLRAHPFATLVAIPAGSDAPEIVHVPLLIADGQGADGSAPVLSGHVARANPFASLVASEAKVTAIVHGPEAYVSAALYANPHQQVPTWNYAVVHLRGRLRPLDDAGLTRQLTDLAERFEAGDARWEPGMLAPAFFADLRRAIVGFTIQVEDMETKLKMSQNRSAEDRARVEGALAASAAPRDREVAALMKRLGHGR